jgi:hypothetical protein
MTESYMQDRNIGSPIMKNKTWAQATKRLTPASIWPRKNNMLFILSPTRKKKKYIYIYIYNLGLYKSGPAVKKKEREEEELIQAQFVN